jgi:hypothetical protein
MPEFTLGDLRRRIVLFVFATTLLRPACQSWYSEVFSHFPRTLVHHSSDLTKIPNMWAVANGNSRMYWTYINYPRCSGVYPLTEYLTHPRLDFDFMWRAFAFVLYLALLVVKLCIAPCLQAPVIPFLFPRRSQIFLGS